MVEKYAYIFLRNAMTSSFDVHHWAEAPYINLIAVAQTPGRESNRGDLPCGLQAR